MKEMFHIFDKDKDKYLNIDELKGFFFNIVPSITEIEFE